MKDNDILDDFNEVEIKENNNWLLIILCAFIFSFLSINIWKLGYKLDVYSDYEWGVFIYLLTIITIMIVLSIIVSFLYQRNYIYHKQSNYVLISYIFYIVSLIWGFRTSLITMSLSDMFFGFLFYSLLAIIISVFNTILIHYFVANYFKR